MRRKVVAVWVSLLIVVSSIVILVEIAERVEAPSYIPHDPFRINGDAEFASMAGSEGWLGDGSPGNPYIIEGYDINGSGYGYCIYVGNTTVNFEVRDSYLHEASGVMSYPYFSSSGIILYNAQNGTIENNTASLNNYNGIFLYFSTNNTIVNNIALNNMDGIFLRDSTGNTITNNTAAFNILENIYIMNSTSNIIGNNTASNSDVGIMLYLSKNNIIDNNNASNNRWGIYLESSDQNTIINNTSSSNNDDGITLSSSSNENIIAKNTVYSNNEVGIIIFISNSNFINNNTLKNNIYGINLESSSQNIIANNTATSNNWSGIRLSGSSSNTIANNSVSNNNYGMFLGSSSQNTIVNNTATSNNWSGINLSFSHSNTITSNIVSLNNKFGIYIAWSIRNKIFHNNIINNTNQAYDGSINANQWDDGYPQGGNYWSDYTGNDSLKGPYQDIPGSDGIGDTPYIIDTDSQDNYPLIEPFTNRTFDNYTILKQGWNLISIPLIQDNQNLTRVLEMIEGYYNAVQWYNNSGSSNLWKHNKIGKPFGNDLFEINETMSFWVHITNPGDTIFLYNGTQPTSNQTIQLHPGWNMVGYPSLTSYNRTVGLNNLTFDTHVDCIQWHEAATQTWHFMGPDDSFVPGRGYWVHSNVDVEWEVPL